MKERDWDWEEGPDEEPDEEPEQEDIEEEPSYELTPIEKLSRDIRNAAKELDRREARYFVSTYYEVQEQRIRARAQARAASEAGEPNELVAYMAEQYEALERNAQSALKAYAQAHPVGRWSLSIVGVGPVIAAGLLAHIDIEHGGVFDEATGQRGPVHTVGHIWRFAGLDPTVKWGKGQKRPWNADLKVLCWKLGESFVRSGHSANEVYASVYRARKELEVARNERGDFAEVAKQTLEERRIGENVTREAYEAGRLPDGRIDRRAKRYAVKLFLAHWHHVAYEVAFGKPPPKPYVLSHMEHAHYIGPPNWPLEEAA